MRCSEAAPKEEKGKEASNVVSSQKRGLQVMGIGDFFFQIAWVCLVNGITPI